MQNLYDIATTCETGNAILETRKTGLVAGTLILTIDGAIPVEKLTTGMRLISRNNGFVTLKDVQIQSITTRPVFVAADMLGNNRPNTDLMLAPDQPVLVRDWRAQALFDRDQALVPVRNLIDGEFIRYAPLQTLTVYDLVFDCQHILYADGLEVASGQCLMETDQLSNLFNTLGSSSGISSAINPAP